MFNLFREFFQHFGHRYKRLVPLVILGATLAGVLEISGLLLLIPFIRLLIAPDEYIDNTAMTWLSETVGADTPLQQACVLGGIIVLIFLAKNYYLLRYNFWQNKILRTWKIDIGCDLMRFYLFAPYKLHLTKTSSQIIRNVNNVVLQALNMFIFQGFQLIASIIAGLVIMVLLLQRTFLFTIITAAVLVMGSIAQYYYLKRKIEQLGKEKNILSKEQFKNIFEGMHAIKETKVLGREQFFLDSFRNINSSTVENDMWTLYYRQMPPRISEIIAIVCVVIMCIGIIHSHFGDNPAMVASLGILAAIAMRSSAILNRIMAALQQLNNSRNSVEILLKEVRSAQWQEYELTRDQYETGKEQTAITFNSNIVFESVGFTYPNRDKPALSDVSQTIRKGEFIGIIGPSGAGKTTFVDILLGLLEIDQGSVRIDGVVLSHENLSHWQRHVGYVPQQVYISDDTAVRNVAFGIADCEIDMNRVQTALARANMLDFLQSLPQKLETRLGEHGRSLSGGQKQRIGIARALYNNADVLVLDEATSALDVPAENEIAATINSLKGSQTIIAIAHRFATLKSCTRLLYFDNGKLVDSGTFESLSRDHEKFEQMLQMSSICEE